MKVLRGDYRHWVAPPRPSAISVGVFDGLHVGHQSVITELLARSEGRPTVVLSFERHPQEVVRGTAPQQLTDEAQKLTLLEERGIDYVALLGFDQSLRSLPPQEFVRRVLVETLRGEVVVVGSDFRFGFQRRGDVAMLRELGQELGFAAYAVDLLGGGEPVSASSIREALGAGDTDAAAQLLGRPYQVRGQVVRGEARGRSIGFPTANVDVDDSVLMPGRGVYAVTAELDDEDQLAGVANIGVRPTFGGDALVLEVHLFDFDDEIYGHEMQINFIGRIREERRFASVDDLVAQIARDAEEARRMLQEHTSQTS